MAERLIDGISAVERKERRSQVKHCILKDVTRPE